jgi:hypothetical protein
MAVAFSVTLSFPAQEKRFQETAMVERALHIAGRDIRSSGGVASSGNINDGTLSLGTWSYTAGAAS